ncbi:hypothetical protein B0T18DRAFT_402483 [Schizothecium vesticola]|uniref:Uncharacterized protein n=1 Tax=Schizothecium vesticola TaxID=314040 RepID=A0AA40F571_9PEZI|nr:hypothetical protein B0T18DRAFT_402483 [Schizothecium vesticola]
MLSPPTEITPGPNGTEGGQRPPARRATRNSITRRALPGAVQWRTNQSSPPLRSGLGAPLAALPCPGVLVLLEFHPPPCAVAFSPWPGSGTAPGGTSAMICSFFGSR